MQKRLICTIHGRVQGIGFRWSIREFSVKLGMTGYVRNREDGGVDVVAEGKKEALEALRAFCYRGPDDATITGVDVTEEPATGEFSAFEIR